VSTTPGHNPLGAISVVALLLVLAAQVGTGLFVVDVDAFDGGPMSDRVSFETGRAIAEIHETIFRVLQALVALHVVAVVYYLVWKRTDLITPMITGVKKLATDPGFAPARLWAFVVGVGIAGAVAWALSKGLRF
jgi:cytochrome b